MRVGLVELVCDVRSAHVTLQGISATNVSKIYAISSMPGSTLEKLISDALKPATTSAAGAVHNVRVSASNVTVFLNQLLKPPFHKVVLVISWFAPLSQPSITFSYIP